MNGKKTRGETPQSANKNDSKPQPGRKKMLFRLSLPFIIVFIFAILVTLLLPRRSIVQSLVSVLVPLVCLIFVYVTLKRAAARAGKTVRDGFAERSETPESSAMVLRKLLACSKLTVLSSIYTDVVLLKKSRLWGFSKTYGIYRYIGELEAGIPDIKNCSFTIDDKHYRIYVYLQPPEILHHTVKKIEKFDEQTSLFCRISNSEVFDEIDTRKKASESLLIEHGFLNEAAERAETVITQLLSALGYSGFDIVFRMVKTQPLEGPESGTAYGDSVLYDIPLSEKEETLQ